MKFVFGVLPADPTDKKSKTRFLRSLADSPAVLSVATQYRSDDGEIPDVASFNGNRLVGTVSLLSRAKRILERRPRRGSAFVFPSPRDPSRPRGPHPELWYRMTR